LADALAETVHGLSKKELQEVFSVAKVRDPTPTPAPGTYISISKRDRLFNALVAQQNADGHANGVLRFVKTAMDPARYTKEPDKFDPRRDALNETLSFASLEITEQGKLIAEHVRQQTGLSTDGHRLISGAFEASGDQAPILALNARQAETERSRQRGLVEVLKAIVSAARNPAAHEPKDLGQLDESDAIDLLTQMSYLHRQLDRCEVSSRVG
jgi:uncharacterized protein (TIGR02391 family)